MRRPERKRKSRVLRTAAGIGAGLMVLAGLAGCSQKEKDYDVYFFNAKSEIAEALEQAAASYEAETGKRVKTFTVGTTESQETLRSELKSKAYPTIFAANAVQFEEWKSAGYALGEEDIRNPELKALYESIPEPMRLQFDGEGNFGIPYNMEGYGVIADTRVIAEMLGLADTKTFESDYCEASYEEFQAMIQAMDAYIKGEGGESFRLNGNTYQTQTEKGALTASLNGVFSIAGAEKWTYGNHFGNYPICAVYSDVYEVKGAEPEQAELLKEPVRKSLEELEFLTRFAAGADGPVERGPRFINSTVTGYDQAVQNFAQGKAVFIKNGNWIYGNVEKISPEKAENLTMLPMKLNLTDADIQVEGLTVEQMNRSIPEFVSQYYVVNSKCTEKEQEEAEAFLLWLNTSETGMDYIVNQFAFVPFQAEEGTVLDNSLSNALVRFKAAGNILSNPFDAAPSAWGTEMYGRYLMEELFIQPETWDGARLEEIAGECVEYWKSGMEEW
ncbi:MAG: ABC transporter substrate-binding protein [Lachnospiraceae bacterium]|nr:ABC transporter substrate-binding protein [Lachnospiraceae bacterium]